MVIATAQCVYGVSPSASNGWSDTFYQYRMPITIEAPASGWNLIDLNEQQIVAAVNQIQEFQYDSVHFAYSYLMVVEVDADGNVVDSDLDAGFYMVLGKENLAEGALESDATHVDIPVDEDQSYFLSYAAEGGGKSPMNQYDATFPKGSKDRLHDYEVSYEPPMLPKTLTQHERLFIPQEQGPLDLEVGGIWVHGITDLSIRQAEMKFMAKLSHAGPTHLMVYYQPMCAQQLMVPEKRAAKLPSSVALVKQLGVAEKLSTSYRLGSTGAFDLWFAEGTTKLTPQSPAPASVSDHIDLSMAGNEAQSFQMVLKANAAIQFENISATSLSNGDHEIPATAIDFRRVEYVPILQTSFITPARLLGLIGDPLIPLESQKLCPSDGNLAIWVTVKADAQTPAGTYQGKLLLDCDGVTEIPLAVTVYDFQLPEFSALRVKAGGQYLAKGLDESGRSVMDYHGLSTKEELKKLAYAYYSVMAEQKLYPKNVAMFSEIGYEWSPPPKGYNVDEPDNYFQFSNWDFTEFNRTMAHFIDELKVNVVTLEHTNPTVCNIFKHLPGRSLGDEFYETPPHVTMASQMFRDPTYAVYAPRPGDQSFGETVEVSREQYEHLTLDYLRAIAENLEKHGWLDHTIIYIDETMDVDRLLLYLRTINSDTLVSKLKVGACMQGYESFSHKENPDDSDYAYRGLYDFYIPQLDENYNRWEKYLFEDYNIEPERSHLWNYAAYTSRIVIDTPGVNNRILGLDLFQRGAGGYTIWETTFWGTARGQDINPWRNPYTICGNGASTFFYPPSREGLSSEPNFKITPSVRVMLHREAVEDYDYAIILENLIAKGRVNNVDVSVGEQVIADINRSFHNSVHWSQNDAWYLGLRERMARAIELLSD